MVVYAPKEEFRASITDPSVSGGRGRWAMQLWAFTSLFGSDI